MVKPPSVRFQLLKLMSDVARTQLGVTKLLVMNDLCTISVISDRGGGGGPGSLTNFFLISYHYTAESCDFVVSGEHFTDLRGFPSMVAMFGINTNSM